jgi:hypothetical protein
MLLWNTVYLERAIATLREHGITIAEEFLAHLSPTRFTILSASL